MNDKVTYEIKEEDIPEPTSYFNPDIYTNREIEIIQLVSWGFTSEAIAEELDIAVGTVKNHRNRIKSRLDAPNVTRVACDYLRWYHKIELENLANAMVGL